MADRAPIWDILAAVGPDRPALDPSPANDSQQQVSFDDDLKVLAEGTMNSLSASGLAIAYKEGDGSVTCHLSLGNTAPPVGALLEISHGISGLCMREGKAQICADTENYPAVDREASRRLGVFSVAVAPMMREGEVIGVVEALADRPNAFTQPSLRQLEALASDVVRRIASGAQATDFSVSAPRTKQVESDDIAAPEALAESTDLSDESDPNDFGESEIDVSFRTEVQESAVITSAGPDSPSTTDSVAAGSSRSNVARRIALFAIIFILLTLFALFFVTAERRAGTGSATSSTPVHKTSPTSPPVKDQVGTLSVADSSGKDTSSDAIGDSPVVGIAPAGSRAGVTQLTFGKRFESDAGGNRDLVKACTWYILSSKAGNAEAQEAVKRVTSQLKPIEIAHVRYNVGKAYATGSGAEQDSVTAYFWLQLAEAAGDERAKQAESKVAAIMAPSEVERAHQMATEWLGKHRQGIATAEQPTLH